MPKLLQDTGKFRTNKNDKFYTKHEVAIWCIQQVIDVIQNATNDYIWVEPSAGSGAFFHQFPEEVKQRYAMDIDPDGPNIERRDFLSWSPPESPSKSRYLVIGNPPFGRQSSLAKRFIQSSCGFSDVVAVILPLSFVKPSMYSAFPPRFHKLHESELPENSFLLNGDPYDVPCVFQIWQSKPFTRPDQVAESPDGFTYVKSDMPHHICVRRVGVYAGQSYKAGIKRCSPSSHYFIQLGPSYTNTTIDDIVAILNQKKYIDNTVGPRSISKPEFNTVMNEVLRMVA